MLGHDHNNPGLPAFVALFALVGFTATLASAQEEAPAFPVQSFDLVLDRSIRALPLPPGGFVVISGSVTHQASGARFDAATESGPGGNQQVGLIDPVASGLVLSERDESSHRYTFNVGNGAGSACARAGLQSPCLALRLPQIAASRSRDVSELREELAGNLRVEVFQRAVAPASTTPPPPIVGTPLPPPPVVPPPSNNGGFWMAAAGMGGGAVLSIALLVFGLRRRKRGTGPLSRVHASAGRLRKKLAGDEVKARLLETVNSLAQEATNLGQTEKQLQKAVREAKPEELERRHQELLGKARQLEAQGGAEAGQNEMADAAKIVESQIERCRKWDMQSWRSAARLERIATRLEALEAELNDPAQSRVEPKQELLDVLQEELDLARAGEREASKLLGRSDEGPASGEEAA